MFSIRTPLAAAILATTLSQLVYAEDSSSDQSVELDAVSITAARDDRVSKGAIGLPLSLKETPQSITTLDDGAMDLYDASGTNDALKMMNGIDVQEYETNRTSYNARAFE
ncbi:MAG: TonB-dependent siderophore receptor, partial [Pseudomonadota bacterium]|nr:TonB-dependent siderophore receptor [Pseudomonadota bacterium]